MTTPRCYKCPHMFVDLLVAESLHTPAWGANKPNVTTSSRSDPV